MMKTGGNKSHVIHIMYQLSTYMPIPYKNRIRSEGYIIILTTSWRTSRNQIKNV